MQFIMTEEEVVALSTQLHYATSSAVYTNWAEAEGLGAYYGVLGSNLNAIVAVIEGGDNGISAHDNFSAALEYFNYM